MSLLYPQRSLFFVLFLLCTHVSGIHIRYNQAGYRPDRSISLVVLSDTDMIDTPWHIIQGNDTLRSGTTPQSLVGTGKHTSHPFNHTIEISPLAETGEYLFIMEDASVQLRITEHPYSVFITDALRHLRTARSGWPQDRPGARQGTHLGDSVARKHIVDGPASKGVWKPASPTHTFDMRGGWYDAGDYIKFTLTNATTAYYLLKAWETNPKAFTNVLSESSLPDILAEARFGLEYLMKTYPEEDIFVVQVGDAEDHRQGVRLPEHDALDGNRPAFTALSPVHMGITAATLAKGARIFRDVGKEEEAQRYLQQAKAIFHRARAEDALDETVFERDVTNDYYRDNSLEDNMALAAVELYRATKDTTYRTIALSYEIGPGEWLSWGVYNFSVNAALAPYDTRSAKAAQADMDHFTSNMDPLWGIPADYTWSSLLCWNAVGAAAKVWHRESPSPELIRLHEHMVDLLFGRNNWGISFLATTRLSSTFQNVYNQIYELTGDFPHGAVALGPVNRETHSAMEEYFGTPPASHLDSFQTDEVVFHDWERNFVTSETVTMSQAYAIWLLAAAASTSEPAPADSSLKEPQQQVSGKEQRWKAPLNTSQWYPYADDYSVATWINQAAGTFRLAPKKGDEYPYAGMSITLPPQYRHQDEFAGFYIYGSFSDGPSLRINAVTPTVTDHDYHGTFVTPKNDEALRITFERLSQQGFGQSKPFNGTEIESIAIQTGNTRYSSDIQIDSLVFFGHQEEK
ncbi:glycoside hydrolase family 9 protein [Chitinivibrio alkaliphilus]|uniref:Glycoside hydrolase, GH9 family n=1 Tax=Chitinivibrio alkaliphilus ACht1 TaxID=1313304 RepID=U7DA09_9BACT|nr:glycoside hydrolase family 9 protein [Chitinivibrio alkaliphilus]ERP39244.1 glycoside hydrolase, GH9 family [Chitinivibrio alkaliphilus ACht1]